jgi:small acid-soluble spore protein F (minor alpha/beta-type SASP)
MATAAKTPGQSKSARAPKELTPAEVERLALKMEAARQLGLWDKVQAGGFGNLTAAESGRIGGLITKWRRAASPVEGPR